MGKANSARTLLILNSTAHFGNAPFTDMKEADALWLATLQVLNEYVQQRKTQTGKEAHSNFMKLE